MKNSFIRVLLLFLLTLLSSSHTALHLVSAETEDCEGGEISEDGTCLNPKASEDAEDNLFRDVATLLDISMHTYGYSALRDLVEEYPDKFEDSEIMMSKSTNSVDITELVSFVRKNEEVIRHFNATQKKKNEYFSFEALNSYNALWDDNQTPWKSGELTFVAMDTEYSQKELVYGIVVHTPRKQVIVTFRGSVTAEDWLRDFGVNYENVKNPFYKKDPPEASVKQPRKIQMHTGFHDYLLKKRWFSKRPPKYEIICDKLKEVMKENPGYGLQVTGHSLGAALSTVFGYFAAVVESLPKPITVISFASPLVGSSTWQTSFQLLEKGRQIQHLRISNFDDIVPTGPKNSIIGNFKYGEYKHVGVNLNLFDNSTYDIAYQELGNLEAKQGKSSVKRTMEHHTLSLYKSRLYAIADELEKLQLEDLYNDP